jgi:uncharacterized protein YbaP (TraB family)
MYKRILPLLVLLFASVVHAVSFDKGLLWEIRADDGQSSYLLGTMHSDDERITRLPASVKKAFNSSQSFTGEVMMDMNSILAMSQSMYFTDGRKLADIIGDIRYQQVSKYLAEYGIPEMMASIMKPWAVATTISLPKPKTGLFLDMMLFQKAQSQGKAVYGLETVDEQMSVLDSMTEEEQINMLDEALENYHYLDDIFQEFVDVYLERDLAGLQKLNDAMMAEGNQEVAEHFEKELLVKRNHLMVERMQSRLEEGDAFIAVGALHLPGTEGILNLLVKQGYRVKALY